MAKNIAIVVPVGPNERELIGAGDIVDALRVYEPGIGPIFLLNDGNDSAALEEIGRRSGLNVRVLTTPRAGQGRGPLGRLTFGLGHVFDIVREEFPGHHIMKLDTDALVIAPFVERLLALVEANPKAGIVGSISPMEPHNPWWWARRVHRMSRWAARWDGKPPIRVNLWGTNALLRALILRAYTHGYRTGYLVCGGAYLVTEEALRRFAVQPELREERVLMSDELMEDIFYTIASFASGLEVIEQEQPGDVFGVCWRGLAGNSLEEVVARNNPLVHSLKDHGPFREDATREYFRVRRTAGSAVESSTGH